MPKFCPDGRPQGKISHMKIAFITSETEADLNRDDRLAIPCLEKAGFTVHPLVWDREEPRGHDAYVFRSCWNYHRKFPQFLRWIDRLESTEAPVYNPLPVSRWNLDKKYLLELQRQGIPMPRTELIPAGEAATEQPLSARLTRIGGTQVVVKPAVSLNGHDTYRVPAANLGQLQKILNDLRDRDVLIQEYLSEIETAGEVSLIFLNGEFSHALRKLPGAGEFRIHEEYGGTRTALSASPQLIARARRVLEAVKQPLLFARVDMVERGDEALLIELELVDPMLFLAVDDRAPARFARALAETIQRRS